MSAIGNIWQGWVRAVWALSRGFAWISAAAIVLAILITMREVFGRYLLDQPTSYAYTGVGILVVAICYLGLAYTASIDGHVSSDIIFGRLPPRVQAFILVISDCVAAMLGSTLAYQAYGQVSRSLATGATIPDLFDLPLAFTQAFVVAGPALLVVVCLTRLPHHINAMITGKRRPMFKHDVLGE